jgi:hypothetical protein
MRKPYCKMSLKDMLEYLSSISQDQPEETGKSEIEDNRAPVQNMHRIAPVQIDEQTQEAAVLYGGRRPVGNN